MKRNIYALLMLVLAMTVIKVKSADVNELVEQVNSLKQQVRELIDIGRKNAQELENLKEAAHQYASEEEEESDADED